MVSKPGKNHHAFMVPLAPRVIPGSVRANQPIERRTRYDRAHSEHRRPVLRRCPTPIRILVIMELTAQRAVNSIITRILRTIWEQNNLRPQGGLGCFSHFPMTALEPRPDEPSNSGLRSENIEASCRFPGASSGTFFMRPRRLNGASKPTISSGPGSN